MLLSGSSLHDLELPLGLLLGILSVLDVLAGGFVHMAPVCSSFVWINLSDHQRDCFQPLGDDSRGHVQLGNKLVERSVMLLALAFHVGLYFQLETPRLSKLELHPSMQMLITHLGLHHQELQRNTVFLGDYGAESPKPIWIYALRELDIRPAVGHSRSTTSSVTEPVTRRTAAAI